MKYFTWDMWKGGNIDTTVENDKKWANAYEDYRKQLSKLEAVLNKRNWRFFSSISLHDGWVLSIEVGDYLGIGVHNINKFCYKNGETTVRVMVFLDWKQQIYQLNYEKVRKFHLNHDDILENRRWHLLQDWGYSELSMVNQQYLQHQIIFRSGAEMSIVFKSFKYKVFKTKKTLA